MRLTRAPDLRHDRAGLHLPGERAPRRLVFRPRPPALFTLQHEEHRLLERCQGTMSSEELVEAALAEGITDSRDFAREAIEALLANGLLQAARTDTDRTEEENRR